MGPCVFVFDGARLHKRRSHLEEFLISAYNRHPLHHQRICQYWKETASSVHCAISFLGHLSPATWFGCCFVSGICDYPLGSGFCSSGWYSHSPPDSFHSSGFVHVWGQENYPIARIQRVLSIRDLLSVGFPNVDLILSCPAAALTKTQVLPTDGANCRDWI